MVRPAEESHWNAAHIILIDQHADMSAALERFGDLHRRVKVGRDQFTHTGGAGFGEPTVDAGNIRPPVEHRAVELVGGGADCRQLPIGEVGRENQRRLAVIQQPVKSLDVRLR